MTALNEQSLPRFDSQIYTRVALNDLVTYAVYHLAHSPSQ